MNRYEIRKALRKQKQQERNKINREVNAITKHSAWKRYEEAFELNFGHKPRVVRSISAARLDKMADELFAAAHEKELKNEVD